MWWSTLAIRPAGPLLGGRAGLGYPRTRRAEEVDIEPAWYTYPYFGGPAAVFVPVPEAKTAKNRVHLDLATTSAAHHEQWVSALLDLGAVPADIGQGDVPWTVLADPEGNEFLRPGAAGQQPGHRPGRRGRAGLRGPGRPGAVLVGRRGLAGAERARPASWGSGRRPAPGLTWSCCGSPAPRWSRTGCILTSRRTATTTWPPEVARLASALALHR